MHTKKLVKTEYQIQYKERDLHRVATIIFVNGEFKDCRFSVRNKEEYNLEDWVWLRVLAVRIAELVKEEEKPKS